jgi:hypothetical protein
MSNKPSGAKMTDVHTMIYPARTCRISHSTKWDKIGKNDHKNWQKRSLWLTGKREN